MQFDYYMPTKILFGAGKLGELHKHQMPGKKALIVISAGKSMRANGYLERVQKELELAGAQNVVFDKILPNPIKEHVMEGASIARQNNCDFIIGLGGGSSIDSAKAIAVMAANSGDYWDYIFGGSGKGLPMEKKPLPIIAITTTAGTGTESDPWTVITNGEEKIGFGNENTFPMLSVVDPELMTTVPPRLTAYQGFDALFHSVEGYIANIATPISEMYSLIAIELICGNLEAAVKNGKDIEAREKVALGNTFAGFVETESSCTSEHSLEHAMSALHPTLAHGAGLTMISREYYTHFINVKACDKKFVDMAKMMGKPDATEPMDFIERLMALQKACGVDKLSMSEEGIKKDELRAVAKNARATMGGLFEYDPSPLSEDDCVAILEKSYI